MTPKTKEWTILGYLAGDNDLAGAAITDVNEMEKVGSTDEMNVVVQIDHAADYEQRNNKWRSTRRYYIKKGRAKTKIESELLADLGETNSGDPAVIRDYLKTAIEAYPSNKTMLVLWNHGSGYYVPPGWVNTERGASTRELNVSRAVTAMKQAFFSTTRKTLIDLPTASERGICFDDRTNDCLDNKELKEILKFTQTQLGGRKLDILGMDACLMTMVEVAYQVKDYARFLVGSEETEPANGWPYHTVLADLAKTPQMDGEAFAKAIVQRYVESYQPGYEDITQSAVDLSKLDDLTAALGDLVKAILQGPLTTELEDSIWAARRKSTSFYDSMYVDIHHFATNLANRVKAAPIRKAAQDVANVIVGKGATTPILAEGHAGPGMSQVKGLSIYWPLSKRPSTHYKHLDFAKKTKWGELLDAFEIG